MWPLPIRLALLAHLALHLSLADTTGVLLASGIIVHELSGVLSKASKQVRRWRNRR